MIARKKRNLIIIFSIITTVFIIIGILVTLYLTTDMFKSKDKLFIKYLSQNIANIGEIIKQEPTNIQETIENNKLSNNLKAKIEYTSNDGNVDNTINKSEIDIYSQMDKKEQYNYKDVRLAYENQDIAKMEYLQEGETYGIRLDGIKQFISAKNENLDELELKTGMPKKNLEFITYMFNQLKLSDAISFTQSELEIISSTYLSILQQNTQRSNYHKKANQNIVANGKTCKATEYALRMNQEEFNNLIVKILERIEKDEIILGKLDMIQQYLEKYYAYKQEDDKQLRDVIIEKIDDQIQDIKNNNIGQEETQILVYEYRGMAVKILVKIPDKSLIIDVDKNKKMQATFINDTDNKEKTSNFIIERNVTLDSQNTVVQYQKTIDGQEQKNIELQISQNLQADKIEGIYQFKYAIDGNTALITTNQYMNIVDSFESQVSLTQDNNISIDGLEQDQAQTIISIAKDNAKEKIKNSLEKITLDDINNMLKQLQILKESEIKFEENEGETITEAERNRFNSPLTFYIGKEIDKDTLLELLETTKDCFNDAQIVLEKSKIRDEEELKGIIIDIKKNTSNTQKIDEIKKILEKDDRQTYTVAMAFEESTKLINKITIVSNKFLE